MRCVRGTTEEATAEEDEEEEEPGVSDQKQKPHTKMWGIRLNASSLYVFKLKNQTELDAFVEESSALVDKKHFWRCIKKQSKNLTVSFTSILIAKILTKCFT